MPLLRGKPFVVKQTPSNLKPEDEVFFFQLTGEVFTDYDEFFERVILCNSLLWSCECTGRNGLTYKEACESEERVRTSLDAIPDPTKRAILELVHQTKRSRIGDITEEIANYLKSRYQDGEIIEIKVKDQWKTCTVQKSYANNAANKSPTTPKSPKGAGKKGTPNKSNVSSPVSPLSLDDKDNSFRFKPADFEYDVQVSNDDTSMKVKGKQLRRMKGSLTKDLVRLLLRQTCKRTTASSDDGYWIVEPRYVTRYALGESFVQVGPLSLETPLKFKQKRKRSASQNEGGKTGKSPAKKRKSTESKNQSPGTKTGKDAKEGSKSKTKKAKKDSDESKSNGKDDTKSPGKKAKFQEKEMTPGQKKKLLEKMKKKELAEKEKLKKKKLLQKEKEKLKLKKEKEEEKQRKKMEREREKEKTNVMRKMEMEFLKEWNRHKDDLKLEDLKELPETSKINTQFEGDTFGDILMVVEFLNIFGTFYDIKDTITKNITYELVEKAILEHDAEGVYYDIVKFLLQTFLNISKEENEEEHGDGESTNGTNTPEEQEEADQMQEEEEVKSGTVSSNATAAAAWPMLHQGMALDELTIDPFTLSEILRLHVLSSGVKIGGARNLWQKRGGFQFTDDPCVDFRHKEKSLLTTLHTSCLYDLTSQDKLKVLCVLCNQILTLTTTRDYIEESFYKVKELKRKLRELQNKEQKRRKIQSAERWRKRMEECVKRKEEIEKRKKEKEAREGEAQIEKQGMDETTQKKKGRSKKAPVQTTKEMTGEQPEQSQSQESKEDQDADNTPEAFNKKFEQTAEEQEEEHRKREEYKREENMLIDEIHDNAVICSEVPLGIDRIYSRYWSLKHINGLLVENDEQGQKLAEFSGEDKQEDDDVDCTEDSLAKPEESTTGDDASGSKRKDFPEVTLNDIINLRTSEKQLCERLFMRYKCEYDDERGKLVQESKMLSSIVDAVKNGINPVSYVDKPIEKWSICQNIDDVINALNNRGLREDKLGKKIEKVKGNIVNSIENCSFFQPTKTEIKPARSRSSKGDAIVVDKSLFKSMDDFLEANLRDQLLDLEEKVWQGSLGAVRTENRESWREDIARKINELLTGSSESKNESGSCIESITDYSKSESMANDKLGLFGQEPDIETEICLNGSVENGINIADIKKDSVKDMEVDSMNINENVQESSAGSVKTLPLKLLEQNGLKDDNSRCTTPVNVCTPLIDPKVKQLAKILLKIENGIERKYLKPPLGEDEDTKKERIREMIEAAQTEFNGFSDSLKAVKRTIKKEAVHDNEANKDEDSDSVTSLEDELKKERTCLERWATSLMAANNFSQIFIHLNTLDRSIMWDKSVLNAKCRKCRKKGDAEKMLLCDGCDRGFHMYCLQPPVKEIPDGDWFCIDCRPKEQRRGQRTIKRPTKLEAFVDSVEDMSEDNDDINDALKAESERNVESEASEYSDEESVDNHSDFCAVCNIGGDLLCCDSCPRSFHTACTYPPIRKAPKGDWSCQVCSGADSDLPKARRVSTLEREREKMETQLAKELSRKQMKQPTSSKTNRGIKKGLQKEQRRGHSSPGPGPSMKQKSKQNDKSDVKRKQNSRKSIGDPTSHSSRRHSDAFGRYERRLCSKIIEELMTADGAEPFLLPVDIKVVTDYLDFIDNPMDLSTIKQNLNKSLYDNLDQFIQDVRLMFTNCETYNQPRSVVARAGSRLSIYFEQRLQELELVKT